MENSSKNLKLYPKYRQISRDFLFFYTINVLFLTQVKKIDMSAVVLVDTFYAIFVVLLQMPITVIIEKIGRKRGIILGNICNMIYLILVMNSTSLFHLVCAEITSAMGFSFKDISEPAILNESIESDKKEKSATFARIQGKAVSGYYALSAISMIISGFLYEINPYLPIMLSLFIVIISLVLSTKFVEPQVKVSEKNIEKEKIGDLKETIIFAFKSKRCRCLLLFSGVFYGIITVLATYEISLLEELNISSKYIGIIFAILNLVSAFSSNAQNLFQDKFKNRTLSILGILLVISCIISGIIGNLKISLPIIVIMLVFMYILKYLLVGLYNVLITKYLSNFTNKDIDTKIFAVNSFINGIVSVIFGIIASGLVAKMSTANAMIIFGSIGLILFIFVLSYMKDKIGLDPQKYSEYELKYDSKV